MKNFEKFLKENSKNDESYQNLLTFTDKLISDLEESDFRLKLLERAISSDYDSILITTLDMEEPGPKIVYVNDGFTKMTGYTREEAIGKTPRMLQGPKTEKAVLDKLKQRLKEGQSFFGHTVNYRKDGSEFINQWDIHPLTNDKGEVTHWVSYQHDITERKRSEQKIVDSQLEFDRLTEESKKTLVDIDSQGNLITSNKAFRDLIGYDEEELKSKKIWELLVEEQIESFKHKFKQFKPSDFGDINFDLILKNRKGNPVEVCVQTRLLTIDQQKVVRASFENKSLQKRIMAILKKRNSQFENMFDTDKDFKYAVIPDGDGNFIFKYFSETFQNITGITPAEAMKKTFRELIHPDDLDKFLSHLNHVLDGKPNTEQYRIVDKDGDYIRIIDYAKPVWNASNDAIEEIKGSSSIEISSALSNSNN
ncbi:MAG: PAS domain S-box protein [Balneolaceae bacterium]